MQAQYISYLIILMITITIIGLLITGFANTWQEWEQTQHYYQIINNIQRICDLFDAAIAENEGKIAYINMPEPISLGYSKTIGQIIVCVDGDLYAFSTEVGVFYFEVPLRVAEIEDSWQERGEWSFFTQSSSKTILRGHAMYEGTTFSMFFSMGVDVDMPNNETLVIYMNTLQVSSPMGGVKKTLKGFRISISVKRYVYEDKIKNGNPISGNLILRLKSPKIGVDQRIFIMHIPDSNPLSVKLIITHTILEVEIC